MRVAIVHPWFLAFGGAEQTVVALAEIFPDADIHTVFCDPATLPDSLRHRKFLTSRLNRIPARYKLYRHLLPLYPTVFEGFDLRGYDLVISSDSCLAKGLITDQQAVHICYCHSPMRCLYDQHHEYVRDFPALVRPIFRMSAHYLRMWDFVAAQRVDVLLANSHNVAERIRTYYNRDAAVVYPPVNTSKGRIDTQRGDYFLTTGRLTPTKQVHLLIEACNRLKKRLIVVGSGRDKERLKALAGETVEFAGYVSEQELADLYARCRAFLFAADEDFGIVPVEAQSYGRPVIAFGHGGSLETVIEDQTGVFFPHQTVDSVADGIRHFEQVESRFHPEQIQQHARRFDTSVFQQQIRQIATEALERKRALSHPHAAIMPSPERVGPQSARVEEEHAVR